MKGGQRGSVPHSLQGAIFSLLHNFTPQTELLREILAMVIVSHHSGLSDGCDISGDEVFTDFIKRKDEAKLNYAEMLNNL